MYIASVGYIVCVTLSPAFVISCSIMDEAILGWLWVGLSIFSNSIHTKYPSCLSTCLICCNELDNCLTSCRTNEASAKSIELSESGMSSILPLSVLIFVIFSFLPWQLQPLTY